MSIQIFNNIYSYDSSKCVHCRRCAKYCSMEQVGAIYLLDNGNFVVDGCISCGKCIERCQTKALSRVDTNKQFYKLYHLSHPIVYLIDSDDETKCNLFGEDRITFMPTSVFRKVYQFEMVRRIIDFKLNNKDALPLIVSEYSIYDKYFETIGLASHNPRLNLASFYTFMERVYSLCLYPYYQDNTYYVFLTQDQRLLSDVKKIHKIHYFDYNYPLGDFHSTEHATEFMKENFLAEDIATMFYDQIKQDYYLPDLYSFFNTLASFLYVDIPEETHINDPFKIVVGDFSLSVYPIFKMSEITKELLEDKTIDVLYLFPSVNTKNRKVDLLKSAAVAKFYDTYCLTPSDEKELFDRRLTKEFRDVRKEEKGFD